MKQAVEIHIEQPDDTASTAFATSALSASGLTFSKGRKHGRRSTSVDNAVDSFFSEVASVENARVLAHAIEIGDVPATDDKNQPTKVGALKWGQNYGGKQRQDTYDAIIGMCNADERFKPTVDNTLKLGSRIKNLIDFGAEVRLADIKLFVETYLTEVYLKSEDVSKYLTLEDLNPQNVEEQAADIDSEMADDEQA